MELNDQDRFIIDNDICWIILYDFEQIEVGRAKFYTKYYEQIKSSNLTWYLTDHGYARAVWKDENNKRHQITLHEAIIQLSGQEVPKGYMIDHKDRDSLNCLDHNLRICTNQQNLQNRGKQSNNTSGHKGVNWHKHSKKWRAQIQVYGKSISLGYHNTVENAARAYNKAAIKYFGEFVVLNNI